jgi:DNA polymerase IV
MPDLPRVIAHLDMDAFYASVELLRYPELRGLPVVIGGGARHQPLWHTDTLTGERRRHFARLAGYSGRGVITTATYEARALGVNSAMGLMRAAQRAPDAVLLPTDFDEYRRYSRLFKAAVREIAPVVEDRGIDEIYIDLTEVIAARLGDAVDEPGADAAAEAWWCAREVAREIKQAVRAATGLSCSIGLAPNKLLAKIASELDKPDGLTVVTGHDIATRIWPLPVRRINGIGPKAAARLARLGIATIGELAAAEPAWLGRQFGAGYGSWLHAAAQGHDERPLVTFSEPKSISRETTFERDLHAVRDRAALSRIFTGLCEQLAADLRRKRYAGRTIGVKLRFDDFRTVTRDLTLPAPTDEAAAIRRAAGQCLKRVELSRRIRLLGVRAAALVHSDAGARFMLTPE